MKIKLLSAVMDFHLDDDDRLESKIQKDIMDYIKTLKYAANLTKISQGMYSKDGVSDIVGCYIGHSVAIEIKRRNKEPTSLQAEYLNNNVRAGGVSGVARSVADVKAILTKVSGG